MLQQRTSQALLAVFALTLVAGSLLEDTLRPRVQALISLAGQGNEQVFLGRAGWMYFRPSLEHVWGAPIGDARPAISHFREELQRAGIELVVVPVPVKVSIDGSAMGSPAHPVNAGWHDFITDLERYEIPHVNAQKVLHKRVGDQYLRTDTHWRPEAMDAVSERVAQVIHRLGLPSRPQLARESEVVEGYGDLVELLGRGTRGIAPERVSIWTLEAGQQDTRGAPILLIGDSFANVYADPTLGFGEGGGMAAALSSHLGVPVDSLLQNDGGASKTRIALQDDIGRLDETLVVVWVFSARELSFGEWTLTPLGLDTPDVGESPYLAIPAGEQVDFSGVILAMSEVPTPASAPYANHLVTLRVQADGGGEGFVRAWSMRNRVLTPLAQAAVGSRFESTLAPWAEAPPHVQSSSRSELSERPRGAPVLWGVP